MGVASCLASKSASFLMMLPTPGRTAGIRICDKSVLRDRSALQSIRPKPHLPDPRAHRTAVAVLEMTPGTQLVMHRTLLSGIHPMGAWPEAYPDQGATSASEQSKKRATAPDSNSICGQSQ
eukprot:scaffold65174_cov38-Prasinocladus_malaysianus.AAC.1